MLKTRILLCFSLAAAQDYAACPDFSADAIQLVTFDVFAALMSTVTSLTASVAAAIPELSAPADASAFTSDWVNFYGSNANATFTPSQTGPLEPFPFVIRSGLSSALASRSLSAAYPPGSTAFEGLALAWARLTPWPDTAAALAPLSRRFQLGSLSNGDSETLRNATAVLLPGAPFTYQFGSDYPGGTFKPNPANYARVLAATGLTGRQVLHIAGSPSDAVQARLSGLQAGLVRNTALPAPNPQPCFVLSDLSTVPALLNATSSASATATVSGSPTASGSPTPSDLPTPAAPSAQGSLALTPSATGSSTPSSLSRGTPSPTLTATGAATAASQDLSPAAVAAVATGTLSAMLLLFLFCSPAGLAVVAHSRERLEGCLRGAREQKRQSRAPRKGAVAAKKGAVSTAATGSLQKFEKATTSPQKANPLHFMQRV